MKTDETTPDDKKIMNKLDNVHILWAAMVLLTLCTYIMGKLEYSGTAVMLVILFIASIKALFIIRNFMELQGVSLLWRVIMYGWLWVICIAIAITYLISN